MLMFTINIFSLDWRCSCAHSSNGSLLGRNPRSSIILQSWSGRTFMLNDYTKSNLAHTLFQSWTNSLDADYWCQSPSIGLLTWTHIFVVKGNNGTILHFNIIMLLKQISSCHITMIFIFCRCSRIHWWRPWRLWLVIIIPWMVDLKQLRPILRLYSDTF